MLTRQLLTTTAIFLGRRGSSSGIFFDSTVLIRQLLTTAVFLGRGCSSGIFFAFVSESWAAVAAE